MPAGIGSATVTPVAVFGPLFLTVSVQLTWLPSTAGFGAPDFVIARSIDGGGGGGGGIALTVTPAVSVAVTSGPTGG